MIWYFPIVVLPWCINTGKSLIPLTLLFLAQKSQSQMESMTYLYLCTKAGILAILELIGPFLRVVTSVFQMVRWQFPVPKEQGI